MTWLQTIFLGVVIFGSIFTGANRYFYHGFHYHENPYIPYHHPFLSQFPDPGVVYNPRGTYDPNLFYDQRVFFGSKAYPDCLKTHTTPKPWPPFESKITCTSGQVCVNKEICKDGYFTADAMPSEQKSKCIAPEVCCRIPKPEQIPNTDPELNVPLDPISPSTVAPIEEEVPIETEASLVPIPTTDPTERRASSEKNVQPTKETTIDEEASNIPRRVPTLTASDIARIIAQTSQPVFVPFVSNSTKQQTNLENAEVVMKTFEPLPIDTNFAEFPWHALILSEKNSSHHCSGLLLSEGTVLTVPACIQGLETEEIIVKLGVWKYERDDQPFKVQTRRVVKISSDPAGYVALKLNKAVKSRRHIDFLSSAYKYGIPTPTDDCITLGWGQQAVTGTVLHRSRVLIVPNEQCESSGSGSTAGTDFFCGRPQIDPCELDVGSALACLDEEKTYRLNGFYFSSSPCGSTNATITFSPPDFACGVVTNVGRCIKKMLEARRAELESQ